MRRSPDARFALDMYESEAGAAVKMGKTAFERLWSISDAIPNSRFRNILNTVSSDSTTLEFDGISEQLLESNMAGTFTTRH